MPRSLRRIFSNYLLAALSLSGVSFVHIPAALAMPAPALQQFFQYDASESPALSDDPASAKPVAVGTVAAGGDTLSLQIGLNEFAGPVNIYFALHAPSIDPDDLYLLKPDHTLQTAAQGLVPWRTNTSAPISETLLGDIPLSALPEGTYTVYLLITQPGGLQSYYLWQTSFSVDNPMLPVPVGTNWFTYSEIPLPFESVNPPDARPIGFGPGLYTKDLRIDMLGYSEPVDVYVARIGPSNPTDPLFFRESDVCRLSSGPTGNVLSAVQTASKTGACKFREKITEPIRLNILEGGPLTSGIHKYYFVVTPHIIPYTAMIVQDYYIWETSFYVGTPACAYTYSSWGECQPEGTRTRKVLTGSPPGCIGTPVVSQKCTYEPPSCPFHSQSCDPVELKNGQWEKAFHIHPGEVLYYYLNAPDILYLSYLRIMMENSDTSHSDVDMLVKYEGETCNNHKPIMDEYKQVLTHCADAEGTCKYPPHGYTFNDTFFMNHSADSYETVEITENPGGCYYIMLYNHDLSTTNLNLGASWFTPPCSYTYTNWGLCQPDGTQTRIVLSSSPRGCTGTPVLTQACTYVPPICKYTYSNWGPCRLDGTQTRTVLSSSPEGCTGMPVLIQNCPPICPATQTCDYPPVGIKNKQWLRGFYIYPGEVQYYSLIANASMYSLIVMMESADTRHTYNVDMLVKYVGETCDYNLRPTNSEYDQVLAGCSGGVTCVFPLNSYTFYMNHSKDSYETVSIPHNAAGCYYVMLYNADSSTVMLNLGASW